MNRPNARIDKTITVLGHSYHQGSALSTRIIDQEKAAEHYYKQLRGDDIERTTVNHPGMNEHESYWPLKNGKRHAPADFWDIDSGCFLDVKHGYSTIGIKDTKAFYKPGKRIKVQTSQQQWNIVNGYETQGGATNKGYYIMVIKVARRYNHQGLLIVRGI